MQEAAYEILKNVFGYDAFRGKQAEVIADVLAGKHVMAIMPTGAGKSLCFQVPALLLSGVTVVVSPLISLMQNQVEALKLLGVKAATINSATSEDEFNGIWTDLRAGNIKLLYLSPERLMTPRMLDAIERLKPACFAIDEAHCISQWGAAFRPEYEDLANLQHRFSGVPIIALTATADKATRDQIKEKIFSGNVTTYLTGFDRPNINLGVEIKNGWKQQLLRFMDGRPGDENGIVYCLSRKKTEEAAALLQEKGYHALPYHAGMSAAAREKNLSRFMAEPDLVMVATIAFGMGIDKPDIRFVFHTDLPASPEAYYQEIGRAGRDGEPAVAHMLYGMDDIRMRRMFIDNEDADDGHKQRGHQRLNVLLAYCEAPECRRVSLLQYFGDKPEADKCGNCDLCANPRETEDATELGQKLLSAMYRTGQSYGIGHIVDVLIGKKTPRVTGQGHDELPTFGVGKGVHVNEWKSIARQMMARGFIASDMEYGSLLITEDGVKLLRGTESFRYRKDISYSKSGAKRSKAAAAITDLPEDAQVLFDRLKEFRREIASERAVPAYVVFSDKSLADMALLRPETLDQFGAVHGVGASKREEFGPRFLAFIAQQ